MNWRTWGDAERDRLAWVLLGAAMAAAAALLLYEGRGLTLFVDEWSFGFGFRTDTSLSHLLEPDNGHLAVVPVLITKAWLQIFGAENTVPLRTFAIGIHLTTALLLFVWLRRLLGGLAALMPAVLILFLGSAYDVIVGSHAMPIQIAVATGLGAWLALERDTRGWDVVATVLLCLGIGSNGFALPFIAGAGAIVLIAPRSSLRRLWVPAVPIALYILWKLTDGAGDNGGFVIDNVAGLPVYAFDTLGAELAAITGLFPETGARTPSFLLGPGETLAGALLVGAAALYALTGKRPPRATLPLVAALLTLWTVTGLVVGLGRMPGAGRYVYAGAILLLLLAGTMLASNPGLRRRGGIVLAVVCAIGLLPNLREIHYGAVSFRAQSSQDKAVMAVAELVGRHAPHDIPLEDGEDHLPFSVPDMVFSVNRYFEAKDAFGTPAYSRQELEGADLEAREAADYLIDRELNGPLPAATASPQALPGGLRLGHANGELSFDGAGCAVFQPQGGGSQLLVPLPASGIWVQPDAGPPVPVNLHAFGEGFSISAGTAVGGSASQLRFGVHGAEKGWEAQLLPKQRTVVCSL